MTFKSKEEVETHAKIQEFPVTLDAYLNSVVLREIRQIKNDAERNKAYEKMYNTLNILMWDLAHFVDATNKIRHPERYQKMIDTGTWKGEIK